MVVAQRVLGWLGAPTGVVLGLAVEVVVAMVPLRSDAQTWLCKDEEIDKKNLIDLSKLDFCGLVVDYKDLLFLIDFGYFKDSKEFLDLEFETT